MQLRPRETGRDIATRALLNRVVTAATFAVLALQAGRAAADPIPISGFLAGGPHFAAFEQDLRLVFPDYTLDLFLVTFGGVLPSPGFCGGGCLGRAIPLTQTAVFSGHSTAVPGFGTIDADVTGTLSFVGPTGVLNFPRERFAGGGVSGPVDFSGVLRVTGRTGNLLFDGTLFGSGTGSVAYNNRFSDSDARLEGYTYQFTGVATTPEPASIVLVGGGLAWLLRRRTSGDGPSSA